MKYSSSIRKIFSLAILAMLFTTITGMNASTVSAQSGTDTNTPTTAPILPTNTPTTAPQIPTDTLVPSATETGNTANPSKTPQGTPTPFGKPLVVMDSYDGPNKPIPAGKTFKVYINLSNHGYVQASNITLTFTSGDFVARETGGVQAVQVLNPGESATIEQQLTATDAVSAKMVGSMTVSISYTDPDGKTYSNDSTVAFNVVTGSASGGSGTAATSTPTASARPQLVIKGYQIDTNPLQPGTTFTLTLNISNVGSSAAKNVTMIMGGGSSTNPSSGTPQPNGVSGGSGEFSNFAPIESSNIQNLGDVKTGAGTNAVQKLIVNVSTTPGAYSVKFSFLYKDKDGNDFQDDQVITLLVYRLPIVDVNFYRTYDPFTVGLPGVLPIQIINLSRNSTVLGTMKVSAPSGELSNETMLVGSLDAGGYFPLDVNFTPDTAGTTEITVTIQYTDDFNQAREITKKLSIEVADAPQMDLTPGADMPGIKGGGGPVAEDTLWTKVVRFVKGLFGLDSGQPVQANPDSVSPETAPIQGAPIQGGKG
jgi:hypothetical protein